MESSVITAILHQNTNIFYITIPKKTASELGIKQGDTVAVKISGSIKPGPEEF